MRRFFLKLARRRQLQRDLEAELAFHHEMSRDCDNPIPLGRASAIKEQGLDLWRFNLVEDLWRDLIYAGRGLRRSPALGHGVNIWRGRIVHPAVAEALGEPATSLETLLG